MYYVNENIKNTFRVFPGQGRYGYLRYDMNENPEGVPEEFVNEVVKEITPEFLAIYPEPDKFTKKYADFVGVEFDNVLATNGSDRAIRSMLETFGEKGKKVVTVAPSFEMYWVNCNILGLVHSPVAYEDDLTINIDKIVDAIDDDTRVVVLLNPNNPIGNVYTDEEAVKVIEKARQVGAIVIIDEAYHYFYDKTFLPLTKKYDNVAILRTFSKCFSLAACRLGLVIAHKQIIDYLKNGKLTFDVNSFALLFGERLLDHPEVIDRLIKEEKEGKAYVLSELVAHGYECRDCKGNFIFIKPNKDAHEITKELEDKKKILVHAYGNELLKKYIRVSVGSEKAMKVFLDAFFELDR